jgi:outer membrane lipoprotein carrier protein
MKGFIERCLGCLMMALMSVSLAMQAGAQGQLDKDFVVRQLARAQGEVEDFAAALVQEKRISLLRRDIVSHGMIEFKRPNKVLIELFDPDPSLMVVDGNSLWLYFKRERVAQRYVVENNPMLKRFLMILENPFKGGWEKLAFIRKEGDFVVLEVVPEEVEAIFSKITLWVSTQDWLIRKLALYEKSGDLTILSYNNIRINTGIPDSHFKINLPTDVEILQPAQP